MSNYCWNGGGSFHGKEWEDHLPTDAAVSKLKIVIVCNFYIIQMFFRMLAYEIRISES